MGYGSEILWYSIWTRKLWAPAFRRIDFNVFALKKELLKFICKSTKDPIIDIYEIPAEDALNSCRSIIDYVKNFDAEKRY